jgi:hypothetical protein
MPSWAVGWEGTYALPFSPLYTPAREVVGVFIVVLAMMARWLRGCRAGLLVGLLGIPLNLRTFMLAGRIGREVMFGRWPPVLVSLAAG